MKLKMALATLGLSVLGATSAFAQIGSLSITFDPQINVAPNFLDYNANFNYTGVGSIFVVPSGIGDVNNVGTGGLNNPQGYTEIPSGLIAGIYPLQLGDLGGGISTNFLNEIVFSLQYDNTAVSTTGGFDFEVFDADPTAGGTSLGFVNAAFVANIGTPVPEPGTVALLVGMGIAGVTLRRRRK